MSGGKQGGRAYGREDLERAFGYGRGHTWGKPLPVAAVPVRRLTARLFDWGLTWMVILAVMTREHAPLAIDVVSSALWAVLALLFLEPLLLWRFCATPGKALLGLRLTGLGGEPVTYGAGLVRHVTMLWCGLGLGLPIFSLVQLWRSFRRGRRGEPQPWDAEISYTVRPLGVRRAAAVLLAGALAAGAMGAARQCAQMPPHRGALTAADFEENFERQALYAGWEFYDVLESQRRAGQETWEYRRAHAYDKSLPTFSIPRQRQVGVPFVYTEEQGRLTAVTLTVQTDRTAELPLAQIQTAVMAFVWAQKDAPVLGGVRRALLQELEARGPGSYALRQAGVTVALTLDAEGFDVSGWTLAPRSAGKKAVAVFTCTLSLDGGGAA